MAATVGFSSRSTSEISDVSRCESWRNSRGAQSRSERLRSPPALNARPSPVRITARTAPSSAAASNSARSASAISPSIALRRSGRASATTSTPSAPSARLTGAGSTRTGSGSRGTRTARSAGPGPTRRSARRAPSHTTGRSRQAALEPVPSVPRLLLAVQGDPGGLEHRRDVVQIGGAQLAGVLVEQALALERLDAALAVGPEPAQHLRQQLVD